MKNAVLLSLTSCLKCPYHQLKQSPYNGDSFDMIDQDLFCKKARHMVNVSCRPWEMEREPIPDWCPLPKVSSK